MPGIFVAQLCHMWNDPLGNGFSDVVRGGSRLSKLDEDVTKTRKEIPRRFKVIEKVREKDHLPRLREDQPAAGAVPRHAAWLHRSATAGDDPV